MSKQLFPDAVGGRRPYPFYGDVRLAFWAFVAIGAAIAARWYRNEAVELGLWVLVLSLVPLVPSYLYVRRLIQWIAGLDELQRRIQQEALVFAAMWTLFLRMGLDLAQASGRLNGLLLSHGLGIEGTFAAMWLLHIVGCVLANRRYQ